MLRHRTVLLLALWSIATPALARATAQAEIPVEYEVRLPAPEHHWAQIEVRFQGVTSPTLQLRMSRSSPGRYALHEFAKNVFDLRATDGAGRPLAVDRPDPHQWDVSGHDGTVVVTYRIYGDRADGTYLQIDRTHAHINAPATFLWARGQQSDRPVRVRFVQPVGRGWVVATQLLPTDDPLEFTAPNRDYLMDSPVEFGDTRIWEFAADDGQTIRVALHHQGNDREALEYLGGVRRIVAETGEIFGEFPRFDGGTYTFIADYLPWASGDGMEHRNSTILSSSASLAQARDGLLGTVAHEFFHAWNVERIRPASLEPFDFESANMSGELWLAEGFTSYYGNLVMHRAGLTDLEGALGSIAGTISAVTSSPGVRTRSAVEMSRLAPFVDAARPVDRTYWDNTFLSYYTYGSALALGLDLTLRDRSDGAITLDDFMRALWGRFGKPDGGTPPAIAIPYTVDAAREVLGQVSGDPAFAAAFFDRHVTGTDTIDYAPLLARAGLVLQRALPDTARLGATLEQQRAELVIAAPTPLGSPAYEAGLDQDDAILAIDNVPMSSVTRLERLLAQHRPGDVVRVQVRHRDNSAELVEVTLGNDPTLQVVPIEATGASLTPAQRAFRAAWLGSRQGR